MQAAMDAPARQGWLVKLAAGLPGGIGNTGFECGGVTSPLVLLGLQHGLRTEHDGLPVVFDIGYKYCDHFRTSQGTVFCKEIRGDARVPLRCVGVVHRSPGLLARIRAEDNGEAIPIETRRAYCELYAHWREQGFHCAHAVFEDLEGAIPFTWELRDGTAAFVGGTLFRGHTCSALTAGVMALGLVRGEIERSRLRVMRMIALMALGRDAFADDVNKFNPTMNMGNGLARWFAGEFGSTQCRLITGCDFSEQQGVRPYVTRHVVERCRTIARAVATQVRTFIGDGRRSS
jgi:hypothetical protein